MVIMKDDDNDSSMETATDEVTTEAMSAEQDETTEAMGTEQDETTEAMRTEQDETTEAMSTVNAATDIDITTFMTTVSDFSDRNDKPSGEDDSDANHEDDEELKSTLEELEVVGPVQDEER